MKSKFILTVTKRKFSDAYIIFFLLMFPLHINRKIIYKKFCSKYHFVDDEDVKGVILNRSINQLLQSLFYLCINGYLQNKIL